MRTLTTRINLRNPRQQPRPRLKKKMRLRTRTKKYRREHPNTDKSAGRKTKRRERTTRNESSTKSRWDGNRAHRGKPSSRVSAARLPYSFLLFFRLWRSRMRFLCSGRFRLIRLLDDHNILQPHVIAIHDNVRGDLVFGRERIEKTGILDGISHRHGHHESRDLSVIHNNLLLCLLDGNDAAVERVAARRLLRWLRRTAAGEPNRERNPNDNGCLEKSGACVKLGAVPHVVSP